MLAFGVCIGSRERYETLARRSLDRLPGDCPIAEIDGQSSICAAYNEILDALADEPGIEAVALIHEDVTIEDPRFCDRILAELAAEPDVAVIGVIGALRPASLRWWQADGRGRVRDSSGVVDFGTGSFDVDVLDGQCLVLSAWAIRNLRFDAASFSGFHSYDVDISLQARRAGRRVRVLDLPIVHHTSGGYGDGVAYAAASRAFNRKWRTFLYALRGEAAPPLGRCLACAGTVLTMPVGTGLEVASCDLCGSGVTLPPSIASGAPEPAEFASAAARARAAWIAAAGARRVALVGGDAATAAALDAHGVVLVDSDADAVALVATLDRSPDPLTLTATALTVARAGALVLAECRNFGSLEAAVDPHVWGRPDLGELRTLLTPAGARRLLERAGVRDVEATTVTSERYDPPALWRARCDHWAGMRLGAESENVLLLRGRAA